MGEHKFKPMGGEDNTFTLSVSEPRIAQMLSAGQVDDALEAILKHGIDPRTSEARQMLAMAYMRRRKFDEAKEIVKGIIKETDDWLSYKMMGDMTFLSVEYTEAEDWYKRALKKFPKHPDVTHDLAVAIVSQGRLDEAIPMFREACILNPGNPSFKHHLSMMLLLDGQMQEGWELMESRMDVAGICGGFPNPEKYWKGQPLEDKTIVLRSEQGFGDTIQFMRYVKRIKEMGAKKIYAYCQPAMCQFVEQYYPGVKAYPNIAPPPLDFDYHANLMSLGLRFSPDYCTEPATEDKERDGIAICWFGSPTHQADHLRTVQIDRFQRLRAAFPNEHWYIGAYGRFDAGIPEGFDYFIDDCRDWYETAERVKKLKLIISVDTALCHLGGFLGVPTWNLIAYVPDFRWKFKGDERTPWYESMRLYRQPKLFEWDSVFQKVEYDLADFLGTPRTISSQAKALAAA